MKITFINLENLINSIANKINLDSISEETIQNIIIGVIAAIFIIGSARALLRLGKRVLIVALLVIFTIFAAPKVNVFILNHISRVNFVEKKLSEIVKGDIEEKVNREYRMATGIDLRKENPELLEELMAEEYAVNPEDSDEINIIKHVGFPQVVLKSILLNVDNSQRATIKAPNFYDYAARFVTLRLITFLSYVIAFFTAVRIIDDNKNPGYGYRY